MYSAYYIHTMLIINNITPRIRSGSFYRMQCFIIAFKIHSNQHNFKTFIRLGELERHRQHAAVRYTFIFFFHIIYYKL